MSSGYQGGVPDLYSAARRTSAAAVTNNVSGGGYNQFSGQQQQFSFRLPIPAGEQEMSGQIRRGEFMGKRSLMEFQQNQQAMEFYLRNVKMRPNYNNYHAPPLSRTEFSNPRFGFPVLRQQRPQHLPLLDAAVGIQDPVEGFGRRTEVSNQGESERNLMNNRLQELERKLLTDEDDEEAVSVVTENEWSEAIRDLIGPVQNHISPSSSPSSSSCTSTSASQPPLCSKQALIEAAVAISEGKPEFGNEILTRLLQQLKGKNNSEKKLVDYMVSALKSRVDSAMGRFPAVAEVYPEEQAAATRLLYRVCPCFMLGFVAANLAILEATSEVCSEKIHVLEFELGQGGQYVHLIHTLAANARLEGKSPASLTITAFAYGGAAKENLRIVGDDLMALASNFGVSLCFHIRDFKIDELTREKLEINSDEAVAVNFAFKLHKLPDESVTVENPRDDLLRRVKTLSPAVVTVVEQELNTNTATLITRVRDAYDYYASLLESLDAALPTDHSDRTKIDDAVGSKLKNSVACDARERVERCEVFGKWRARLSMAGFQSLAISARAADSIRAKLNAPRRVKPGFTVSVDSGGICFGWRGKTLAFASAWR